MRSRLRLRNLPKQPYVIAPKVSRCTISVALGAVVKRRVRKRINRLTEQRIRDVECTIEIQAKPLREFVLRNFPMTEDV